MKVLIVLMAVFFCLILTNGCLAPSKKYWAREEKKVEECRNKWIYKDLENEQEVTVLYFSAGFKKGILSFPNFLIVRTKENDTIAFLDKDYHGKINLKSKIKLLPIKWEDAEKSIIKPAFVVRKRTKENEVYCKVKEVYYGKLDIPTSP